MPERGKDLGYINIDDFTPGIWDDWYGSGGAKPAPLGAAQKTGTYGCLSGRGGGLIAGPRRVNRMLETLLEVDGTDKYPPGDAAVHVTNFKVLSPVLDRTGFGMGDNQRGSPNPYPDDVFVALEWYYGAAAAWKHKCKIRVYKMFLETALNPAVGGVATYDIIDEVDANVAEPPYLYGYTGIDLTRSNVTDPTSTAYAIAACMYVSNRDITNEKHVVYPDNATPNTDSVANVSGLDGFGGFGAYSWLTYQDRIVAMVLTVNSAFGTDGELPYDGIMSTAPADYSSPGIAPTQFVAENPGPFGSWYAANASELLFIKQQHGGFVVRGSLFSYQVVRLPGLEPTYEAVNIGTLSPEGQYVYGTTHGVYGWSGGDNSPQLSPQLDGWFWKPGDGILGVDNIIFAKGSFARVQQYIFAPNNYIYDCTTKSWWRLINDDTLRYAWADTNGNGQVVLAPAYVSTAQQVLADWYDIDLGQNTYKWTSQPLVASLGRVLQFRTIDLKAQGVGTVTITLKGLAGTTQAETFAVNSATQPVLLQKMTAIDAEDVIVIIDSVATDTAAAAPRVLGMRFGYYEEMTARG